jgi:hypothetical protein
MPTAEAEEKAAEVKKSITLRCFVYRQRSTGLYVAECIDLDLMVKAKSAKKAMREIRDSVMGYVRVAIETGQEDQLIPRPSPLTHRLLYHTLWAAARVANLQDARVFNCEPAFCCA